MNLVQIGPRNKPDHVQNDMIFRLGFAYGISQATQSATHVYKQLTITLLVADLSGIIDDTLKSLIIEFNELLEKLKFPVVMGVLLLHDDKNTCYVLHMSYCFGTKCPATVEPTPAPTHVPRNDDGSCLHRHFSMIYDTCSSLDIDPCCC